MRAFVAVDVDGDTAETISRFQAESGIDARRVRPQSLHFTLQFLGDVQAGAAKGIAEALEKVKFSSFAVGLRGVGAFPRPESPRVVWIGTDDGRHALERLAGSVRAALAPLGFSCGKPFQPHVTVLRAGRRTGDIAGILDRYVDARFGSQRVARIKLKQSVLTPDGPVYSDLAEVAASA